MFMLHLCQIYINKLMQGIPQGTPSSYLFMEPAGLGSEHYGARR